MTKTWFGNIVGDHLYKSRFVGLCDAAGLTKVEKQLAIARFNDRKKVIQCEDIATTKQQALLIPIINAKIESFFGDKVDYFTDKELDGILKSVVKRSK